MLAGFRVVNGDVPTDSSVTPVVAKTLTLKGQQALLVLPKSPAQRFLAQSEMAIP
jgi:hypothetical protein